MIIIESVEQYERILDDRLDALNIEPSMDALRAFESSLDFWSDIYKDEYGIRPSCEIYRRRYNDEVKMLFEKFWEEL